MIYIFIEICGKQKMDMSTRYKTPCGGNSRHAHRGQRYGIISVLRTIHASIFNPQKKKKTNCIF